MNQSHLYDKATNTAGNSMVMSQQPTKIPFHPKSTSIKQTDRIADPDQ